VNEFLAAVFRQPLLISDILKSRGFSDHQIKAVKNQAARYLALLVSAWCDHWHRNLTPRQIVIIAHFYSFNGQASGDKRYLAKKFNMSTKRITKQLNEGMRKLRHKHKKELERTILTTATKILPNSSSRSRK
jgi:DNA-directed RNA polymerase sigma subunit (sigma70/sigma32)